MVCASSITNARSLTWKSLPLSASLHFLSELPSYRILQFCNGFWPQNTPPENSVPFNGNTSSHCQKVFFSYHFQSYADPLNHCYFTLLLCGQYLNYYGKSCDRDAYKCSSLSPHTHTHTTTTTFTSTNVLAQQLIFGIDILL